MNRDLPLPIPTSPAEALAALAELCRRQQEAIERLQAQTGQTLPADYRFAVDEAGNLTIARVSTGGVAIIAGPL